MKETCFVFLFHSKHSIIIYPCSCGFLISRAFSRLTHRIPLGASLSFTSQIYYVTIFPYYSISLFTNMLEDDSGGGGGGKGASNSNKMHIFCACNFVL